MTVFHVNITGPDGKQYVQGEPVPKSWDADYVKSLVASGGAGTQKAWDEIAARNAAEAVTSLVKEYRAGKAPAHWAAALDAVRDADADGLTKVTERARIVLRATYEGGIDAIVKGVRK